MDNIFATLPEKITKNIFSNFRYGDLAILRQVNRWFKVICSQLLNKAFLRIKSDLEIEILALTNRLKLTENRRELLGVVFEETCKMQLKYKIMLMLKSEICVLYALCEKYVKCKLYTFSGGKILDSFFEIMNKNFDLREANNPFESNTTLMLFLLCEEFMDHFEEYVEPSIVGSNFCPWYGTKIVDLLDLHLNSNYHITTTYQQDFCQISGRYEILNPESITELKFNEFGSNLENIRRFSRYVRNQMRWHNFFYYVDATYESMSANRKKDRRYSKFCLNNAEISDENGYNKDDVQADKISKTFSRRLGNPCSKENICYAIELQCSKNCAPARLEQYFSSMSQGDNNSIQNGTTDITNSLNNPNNFTLHSREAARAYDFLLTLKVVMPSESENLANENHIELYHSLLNCEMTQKTKEIPI